MNFNQTDARKNIRKTNVSDYKPYSDYEIINSSIVKDNILDGFDKELQQQIINNTKAVSGIDMSRKEGFGSSVEGFDNHGYIDNNSYNYNAITSTSIPDAIINQKIIPLAEMTNDYSHTLGKINSTYVDLSNNIQSITGVRDIMKNDPINKYQFNAEDELKKKQTITDALIEDKNAIILQQNDMYMLGTITVATLLIAAIYIAKE